MNDEHGTGFTICCDECSMRCTAACDDCVVNFLLDDGVEDHRSDDTVVLDRDQARVVQLFGRAGLVPELRYRDAG